MGIGNGTRGIIMVTVGACAVASQKKDKELWERAHALSSWHLLREPSPGALAASRRDLLPTPQQLSAHPSFQPGYSRGCRVSKRQQDLSCCIHEAFWMAMTMAEEDSPPK